MTIENEVGLPGQKGDNRGSEVRGNQNALCLDGTVKEEINFKKCKRKEMI